MGTDLNPTQLVCLDYGGATCTYIETAGAHIDEQESLRLWLKEKALSPEELHAWATNNLTVVFDGDLDNPENFKKIKAIGLYGPNIVDLSEGSLSLSGFSVHLEVEYESDIQFSEEDFEDIFHLIIPVIKDSNSTVAFTEFVDYSVIIEDANINIRPISVNWETPEI